MTRQTVAVSVYYSDGSIDMKLAEYIAKLTAVYNDIPQEYQNIAEVEIRAEQNYDMDDVVTSVTYHRPETDEELATRQQNAKIKRKARLAQLRVDLAFLESQDTTP
jgi:DNA topoisomerase VI subunit A